jgi:hypothetical protein
LASNLLEFLDPLRHFGTEEYVSFWHYLFSTLLQGFWARLIASLSILFSFWFGVYRRRIILGIVFFMVSFIFAYFGSLLRTCFWWWK